jgi:hypothetical protein
MRNYFLVDDEIYNDVVKMKYSIPNKEMEQFDRLLDNINEYYDKLYKEYV